MYRVIYKTVPRPYLKIYLTFLAKSKFYLVDQLKWNAPCILDGLVVLIAYSNVFSYS